MVEVNCGPIDVILQVAILLVFSVWLVDRQETEFLILERVSLRQLELVVNLRYVDPEVGFEFAVLDIVQ